MNITLGSEKRIKTYQRLMGDDEFLSLREKFRSKYGVPREGFSYKDNSVQNRNHISIARALAKKYATKDISYIKNKYKISEVNRSWLIDLLLFKDVGISRYNFDIHTYNIPSELNSIINNASKLIPSGKARIMLSINGTTRYKDVSNYINEVLDPRINYLRKNKNNFRVISKNHEVLIEIFKNTRACHFNKKSWEELVVPKQKKLIDYDLKSFKKYKNYDKGRVATSLLEEKTADKIIEDIGYKVVNDRELTDEEKMIQGIDDYSYLYTLRRRHKKMKK